MSRRRSGRRARQAGWNAVGLVVFAVMVFPVFWMISTAFKPDEQINSLTPTWFSGHPTLRHFRRVGLFARSKISRSAVADVRTISVRYESRM